MSSCTTMGSIADDLLRNTGAFYDKHRNLADDVASVRLSDDKWSLKEIIGHLVDSASNNHQRFVRLRLQAELRFQAYEAESWIGVQNCNAMTWDSIFSLWRNYNCLLANIIRGFDDACLGHVWVADERSLSLESIVIDYSRHLIEHLAHFESRLSEIGGADSV